jgi:hypothetical protein
MFQFPRCPPELLPVPDRASGGLPHSEISGSQAASASPEHFAAWPRPSSAANAKASTMRSSSGTLPIPDPTLVRLAPPGPGSTHHLQHAVGDVFVPVPYKCCLVDLNDPQVYIIHIVRARAGGGPKRTPPRPVAAVSPSGGDVAHCQGAAGCR